MGIRHIFLSLCMFCSFCVDGQTLDKGIDFKKAEEALETVMDMQIEDEETKRQCGTIAGIVGVHQFVEHRYDAAVKSLDYAIKNTGKEDEIRQIMNHVFLVHSLCMTNNRRALEDLQALTPLLQDLQANTMRGDFPAEYADGMRMGMNTLLFPLTSLVAKTFPDKEALEYCFNLMLYLKQFSFYQLTNRQKSDIKHHLFVDYRDAISRKLGSDEIVVEFVPYMHIEGSKNQGVSYAAYILEPTGELHLIEVCRKDEAEQLFNDNEQTWLLYADHDDRLRSVVWNRLKSFVRHKKKIFVSPCGILNRVNFMLFDPKVYELTNSAELIKTYTSPRHSNALLIGDVDYDSSIANLNRGDRDWGMLRGTRLEIENIGKSLSPSYTITKLTQDVVTEQHVRDCCNKAPAILHLATHAICYTDSIDRSRFPFFQFPFSFAPIKTELTYTGLVLSGGNQGFMRKGNVAVDNDGILLAEEISKLNLVGTSLVVLAACDSGNGVFDDIEGTLGLVKAFKIAGAKTIVASLSKVDDDAASEMMSAFYRRMASNREALARDLRAAPEHQRSARGKENLHSAFVNTVMDMKRKYPHTPKNWAAFKLIDCID